MFRLRDWEQGLTEPDQPMRAYLKLIARDPDHVNLALNPKASETGGAHSQSGGITELVIQ
jgi:hypothetical protein